MSEADRVAPALAELVRAAVSDPAGPGAVLALVAPDGSCRTAGRGMAELEHEIPIEHRTVFHLASLSKQFTAEAAWRLVQSGSISLHDRVADHLSWFPFETVTVEHLVRHSSGVRDQWQLVEASGKRLDDVITTADLVRLIERQQELQFEPGTWHEYSNTNYTLLALLVEGASGESLDDFCRKHVFDPLGMHDTLFMRSHRQVVPGRASSYRPAPTGYERMTLSYATTGASGLNSTVADLARWVAAADERKSWHADLAETPYAGTSAYGWGVRIGTWAGQRMIWHAGADAGYRTHLAVLPDSGWAAIALANCASIDPEAMVRGALDLVVPADVPPPVVTPPDRSLAGTYLDVSRGVAIDVAVESHGVRLDAGQGTVRLPAIGQDRYSDGYVVVEMAGRDLLVSEDPALRMHQWMRLQPPPGISATELERFTGNFYSTELDVALSVLQTPAGLVLDRRSQGRQPMVPVAERMFRVLQDEDSESSVVTLVFDQAGDDLTYSAFGARDLSFRRMSGEC